ncbi:MAG TPA: YlxR family protein [Bacillota bacterium]|nr:YlxR family protein [Bacillota bacterium]HOG53670.1 YlxR family protein [Bacillota bacterium]
MKRAKKQPIRTCLGCGGTFEKRALVRIVRTPEGDVKVDPTGKLPGRGAYVCDSRDCLEKAVKAKKLQRSLEREVSPEVIEQLRASLEVQGGP